VIYPKENVTISVTEQPDFRVVSTSFDPRTGVPHLPISSRVKRLDQWTEEELDHAEKAYRDYAAAYEPDHAEKLAAEALEKQKAAAEAAKNG
ncbi:hypothetical protein WDZ92_22450, partial [Nostoc sp. NIES-2111]